MRLFLFSILLLALPVLSFCQIISPEQAAKAARNFYYERVNLTKVVSFDDINIKGIRTSGDNHSLYYVCEMQPSGFVVVSAFANVKPVLAFSFESNYLPDSELPEGFDVWMDHYRQQIKYAIDNQVAPADNIASEWQRLLSDNFSENDNLKQQLSVEPLLVSKWNQDSPYNGWCPVDPAGPGGRCYAGCVATAMGQLQYYYRFPFQGQGSYSYVRPVYGTISADFGNTSYNWNGMLSGLATTNDPVAELLFHQGVSVDMEYGPSGSGMTNHKAAFSLKNYFRYGPETQYYFRDSVTLDWDSLLITNLDQRKPMYYAGWAGVQSTSGHAFVCDGYQPGNYYHFNWGWGGSQDGYFYTDNLTPGGNNFNFAQEVIPMFPDTIQNIYPIYCQGLTTMTDVRGSIEDGSGGWYDYSNNSSCTWLIAPQSLEYDSIKNIKITFYRFDTETGADSLLVYDGENASYPLIGAFTGNTLPGVVTSSGNKVFIAFHSNATVSKAGWQLDYESIFPVYCTGIATLNSESGTIEDGSQTKKYNNNSMCRWKIMPSSSLPVTFTFTSFDTFDSSDFVKIIDLQTQEILGSFSGFQLPQPVTASSGKMLIMFVTNGTGNAQGFQGEYSTSGVGLKETNQSDIEAFIYPNPANGIVTIGKTVNQKTEIIVQVINQIGELMYKNKFKLDIGKNKMELNLNGLPESTYFLIIKNANLMEIKKLVIIR